MPETISKEKEKKIISAARNIFARYGFSKTTMEDISAEVEMGKASLYYYFPNKESLFEAAIAQERDEFMLKIEKILDKQDSASQKLRSYVEERIEFFQELINLGMLSYNSYQEKKSVYLKLSNEFGKREIQFVERIIEQGKSSNEFRSDLPQQLATIIIHLMQGLRLRAIRNISEAQFDSKLYRQLKQEMLITVDVFIRGIKNNL